MGGVAALISVEPITKWNAPTGIRSPKAGQCEISILELGIRGRWRGSTMVDRNEFASWCHRRLGQKPGVAIAPSMDNRDQEWSLGPVWLYSRGADVSDHHRYLSSTVGDISTSINETPDPSLLALIHAISARSEPSKNRRGIQPSPVFPGSLLLARGWGKFLLTWPSVPSAGRMGRSAPATQAVPSFLQR